MVEFPRQLAEFTPAAGLIKADYTDFVVEELPLYPADGAGTHTYFLLEKAGLTTHQAVHDIARALNVRRHEIGFAGLKDARAVTRQWMSVEHVEPERVTRLALPRMHVVEVTRHRNKLRLGHLKGNRFAIKVRRSEPDRLPELREALAELERCGAPNYFGSQRFGYRGDTWAVGRAIIQGQLDEAIDLLLGRAGGADHGGIRQARVLYDRGKYAQALRCWPPAFRTERRALKALAQSGGKRPRAFHAIDRTTRNFYISAYQSLLLNRLIATRLPTGLGCLWDGDLAWVHASAAVFRVERAALDQPRADRFEISPSGPLFGYRMTEPTGQPGRLEAQILTEEGLSPSAFRSGTLRVKGSRRPLRFQLSEAQLTLGADQHGAYLEFRFVLPRGCYATAVLDELFDIESADGASLNGKEIEAPVQ